MQRKEATRSGRSNMPSAPSYPTYTPPPTQPAVTDTYDSYNAEKNKSFQKSLPARSKGMQLGKKTKTTSMFEQVRGDLGPEAEAPLIPSAPAASAPVQAAVTTTSSDRDGIHITVAETISAKLSREGSLESFEVKGDLQLRITDPSLTQVQLALALGDTHGAQLNSHPKVDKTAFKNDKIIQLTDTSKGFPANNSIGVMRWRLAAKAEDISDPPITFTAWVNETGSGTYNITLEYELTGGDALNDVTVSIPYQTSEPSVSSFDAVYEVSGDSIDWTIGDVDDTNATGSFEFEAQAESEAEFFPMSVRFAKTRPYVDVDVSNTDFIHSDLADIDLGIIGDSFEHGPRRFFLKGHQVGGGWIPGGLKDLVGSGVIRLCHEKRTSIGYYPSRFYFLILQLNPVNVILRYVGLTACLIIHYFHSRLPFSCAKTLKSGCKQPFPATLTKYVTNSTRTFDAIERLNELT